ncbi:MAG: HNH endonuclease [Loktanella sp.]|nr:HNH endonuclease [Loktanella sp.]
MKRVKNSHTDSRTSNVIKHRPPVVENEIAEIHNHKWYHQKRWTTIRLIQLSKQPLCQRCLSYDEVKPALHVDHVMPHAGDAKLFFNTSNLQSLCHSCHSFKTKAEQRGEYLDFR